MPAAPFDLRRSRPSTPARTVAGVGVISSAAMVPLMALMVVVHPFGTVCGNGQPGVPCTTDIKLQQQLALDVLGLLILDAVVLAGAIVWALRRPDRGEHLGTAIAATAGLLALSAAAPLALSSLGSSHRRDDNEWWALVWLLAPPVLLAVRRVTGRIWPALLALLPAALALAGGLLLL
jgi:hypothetical protein